MINDERHKSPKNACVMSENVPISSHLPSPSLDPLGKVRLVANETGNIADITEIGIPKKLLILIVIRQNS
jgi:hypothetical protein